MLQNAPSTRQNLNENGIMSPRLLEFQKGRTDGIRLKETSTHIISLTNCWDVSENLLENGNLHSQREGEICSFNIICE